MCGDMGMGIRWEKERNKMDALLGLLYYVIIIGIIGICGVILFGYLNTH
jgi:hypothetical protein